MRDLLQALALKITTVTYWRGYRDAREDVAAMLRKVADGYQPGPVEAAYRDAADLADGTELP